MKVLVTGGAGFIGSHLVEALFARGETVRVLDDLSTGKVKNLEEATGYPVPPAEGRRPSAERIILGDRAEFIFGNITDFQTCRAACEGVACVFHLAALGSVQRSVEDPLASHQANASGTLHMLLAAKEAGVRRFLYEPGSDRLVLSVASGTGDGLRSSAIHHGGFAEDPQALESVGHILRS